MAATGEADGKIALVTGGNKGIGFEIVRGLAQRGATIYLAARDEARGAAAAASLRAEGLKVTFLHLEVTDGSSASLAAQTIGTEHGKLDILVNNAGINLESTAGLNPLTTPLDVVKETFETNLYGPIRLIQAFLTLLSAAPAGRIVNVTSELGSLELVADPQWANFPYGTLGYGPSKSALNAVTLAYAKALASTAIKVNAVCPGLTATDLSGNFGDRTAAQGAVAAIRMALIADDGPNGTIYNEAGRLPW